jgi:double zinc ribbon protein
VTDVERFFRRLVNHLAATDPSRLRRPVPLEEIYREILPYRANRRALELATSEEYELVLLRLCAGEGSLVRTEPEEARARFAQELRSANPDLDVLRSFEDVQVTFRVEPLMQALEPLPGAGHAPLSRAEEPEPEPEPDVVLGAAQFEVLQDLGETETPDVDDLGGGQEAPAEDAPPSCIYCGGSLPTHRAVNFCPHCGQSQTQILCPECRSEVEPGWRHCVNCGAAVGEG